MGVILQSVDSSGRVCTVESDLLVGIWVGHFFSFVGNDGRCVQMKFLKSDSSE